MKNHQTKGWSRREFLEGLALAGTAAALGWPEPSTAAVDPPPETTRLRIRSGYPACYAPIYVAEPLLRKEGFTDVQYVFAHHQSEAVKLSSEGAIDLLAGFSVSNMYNMEQQHFPVKIISGLHTGCYALVASNRIHSVRDLKGKTVWVGAIKNDGPHIFFSTLVSYVGVDPRSDINFLWVNQEEAMRLFREGKIDAFITFPPWPQDLIDEGIGHILIDTNIDKPWSQYFCCVVTGQSHFIKNHPVATKRALRAILRAIDIVARDPRLAAHTLLEKKIRSKAEYRPTLRALSDVPYDKWRDFNPEDTIRFYALRMRDIGMLASAPQQFIDEHTDWRFINELKKELRMAW